jgi:predicted PurR-regulated permease PerM
MDLVNSFQGEKMKSPLQSISHQAVDAAIKIGAIVLLVYWCFEILRPFIMLVVWAAVIATALYPVAILLSNKLKLSPSKASYLLVLIGVLLMFIPTYLMSGAAIEEMQDLYNAIETGILNIPPPSLSVKEWPVVGEKSFAFFTKLSRDLEAFVLLYQEPIKDLATTALGIIGGVFAGLLKMTLSLIIAGVFMSNAAACEKVFSRISIRLAGESGKAMTTLTVSTIRSVVQGVLGVAVIQSVLAGIGLYFAGSPMVGLWMLAVLFVAIIQLPPILALIPPIIIAYTGDSSFVATALLVWCLLVSASDAVLKPMLIGRGSDVPMLVILLGAIGGMAMSGIIGLFVGAVVLAVTHNLFMAWLAQSEEPTVEEMETKGVETSK